MKLGAHMTPITMVYDILGTIVNDFFDDTISHLMIIVNEIINPQINKYNWGPTLQGFWEMICGLQLARRAD